MCASVGEALSAPHLAAWLAEIGVAATHLHALPGDVSPRRYFRVGLADAESAILAVYPDTGATRVAVDDVFAPSAVKFDHRGRLVVTEAGTGDVTVVSRLGGELRHSRPRCFQTIDGESQHRE